MGFVNTHPTLRPALICTKAVDVAAITETNMKYFDKDGFELTPLEQMYYEANNIGMNDYLYNHCAQQPWIVAEDLPPGLMLDHSMVLERYAFAGEARSQLLTQRVSNPSTVKLLSTHQKWGIDFSLDFVSGLTVVDVFHIEQDSYSFDEICQLQERASQIILNTDWLDGAHSILRLSDAWVHLEGHAQSDWKAKYFGFNAAELIRKAF